MKIWVTGGAGYIGSVLVPEFPNKDWEVIAFDNYIPLQQLLLDCCMWTNTLRDLNKVVCLTKRGYSI